MTLFAGIFSRHEDQPISDSACDGLSRVISRDKTDEVSTFRDPRCFIAKVDIGAFNSPAFRLDENGLVSVLAGEPLLEHDDNDQRQNRTSDLDELHESWKREDWGVVRRARGVFSAAHFNAKSGRLFLISDKLCIRPLYFWANEQFVIFATALRILENLNAVPKTIDLRGVTELCGLGYPLGTRTPYAGISLLNGAEIVGVDENRITRDRYWRWDTIEPSQESESELLSELRDSFTRAVSIRLGEDKSTVAYLSGGLDSRCAVAALIELGSQVHTFNFALPDTQDYLFGNEFALQAGTIHEAVPKEHGDLTPDYSTLMARAWNSSTNRVEHPAERSTVVWSGEGGSVALGHVHLSKAVVELMRAGKTDEAIEAFLGQEQASVTHRLLKPEIGDGLTNALHDGISGELKSFRCADSARNFYLFLMLNDQRRKLSSHFESIDLHRLEFELPFFDSDFIARVGSLPIDECLRHKFYLKWLSHFMPVVTDVPWQSYPGHEPCPQPAPQQAAYQWDNAYQDEQANALKRELLDQAKQMLRASDFPTEILRKQYLRIATMIYRFGLRDYSYVIQTAWKYFSYWKQCNGKLAQPVQFDRDRSSSVDIVASRFDSKSELTSSAVE